MELFLTTELHVHAMELTDDAKYQALKNTTVLNVDDSDFNQFIIQKILEGAGVNIITANNGAIAVTMLKEGLTPDVILMDLQMPVMNGTEASWIIKKEINAHIPIIINSGYVDGVERWKLKRIGVVDFLEKPYTRDDILSKIVSKLPHHDQH